MGWIERGVGEVKLPKHRENSMVRVLMRQEKTMKIICNHVVDPRIELEPNVGSDRSWVWSAWDFSSGELEDTIFAIRFGNSDSAKEYKEAFEKAKAHMKALKDGADGERMPKRTRRPTRSRGCRRARTRRSPRLMT